MKRKIFLAIFIIILSILVLASCTNNVESIPSVETATWQPNDSYTIELTDEGFVTDKDYIMCIEKEPNKDFIVLNLTDIQLGDGEIDFSAEFVRRADKTIDELVKKVKPDLITVTGDQGYGTKKSILYVGSLLDRYGIPWAPVFGNHDNDEGELKTGQQAYLYENSFKNCLFKSGPDNLSTVESSSVAWGNYIINVVERDQSERKFHVVKSLVFVNSGNNYDYSEDPEYEDMLPVNDRNYAMISPTQIEWYKWAIKNVQPYGSNGEVKSAMFMHIPIYAYNVAFYAAYKSDVDMFDIENYNNDVINNDLLRDYADKSIWNNGYENSTGGRRETIASAPYDDHVFDAILDFDDDDSTDYISTDLIVAGHDHINSFIIEYQGVTMAYGLKTGSGCYWNEDLSGGSVIMIRDNGNSIMYHQFTDIEVATYPWWIYLLIAVGCLLVVSAVVLFILFKKGVIKIHK